MEFTKEEIEIIKFIFNGCDMLEKSLLKLEIERNEYEQAIVNIFNKLNK